MDKFRVFKGVESFNTAAFGKPYLQHNRLFYKVEVFFNFRIIFNNII